MLDCESISFQEEILSSITKFIESNPDYTSLKSQGGSELKVSFNAFLDSRVFFPRAFSSQDKRANSLIQKGLKGKDIIPSSNLFLNFILFVESYYSDLIGTSNSSRHFDPFLFAFYLLKTDSSYKHIIDNYPNFEFMDIVRISHFIISEDNSVDYAQISRICRSIKNHIFSILMSYSVLTEDEKEKVLKEARSLKELPSNDSCYLMNREYIARELDDYLLKEGEAIEVTVPSLVKPYFKEAYMKKVEENVDILCRVFMKIIMPSNPEEDLWFTKFTYFIAPEAQTGKKTFTLSDKKLFTAIRDFYLHRKEILSFDKVQIFFFKKALGHK